jgi:hypothetical protein
MTSSTKHKSWELQLTYVWVLVAFITCVVSVWAQMQIGLNNDHLDLLDQARRLLEGGKPYVAYSDINPPLIHMLYTLPSKFAKTFGFTLQTSLYTLTFAVIAFGLIVSDRMLSHSAMPLNMRLFVLGTIALCLVSASFIHQPFGDREHLMMVFTAPWYVFCSPLVRRESVPVLWRALVAILAGIGFAIKPYFYVFYVATVGYMMMSRQSVKSVLREWEHYIIWAIAAFYLVIIFTIFDEYIKTVLPLTMKTYGTMNWSLQSKLSVLWNDLLLGYSIFGLIGAAYLWVFKEKLYHPVITYLLFLLVGAIGSYLLNGGWYYTQYPFIAVSLALFIAVSAPLILMCRSIVNWRQQIAAVIVTFAIAATCILYTHAMPAQSRAMWDMRTTAYRGEPIQNIPMQAEARKKIDEHLQSHPRFIFMTTSLRAVNLMKEGSPVVNVGRYDYFWPLPGILSYEKNQYQRKTYESLIEYFIGTMVDDIRDYKPDMVIHNVSPQHWDLPPSYRMLDLFLKDKRFEEVWRDYALVDTINACTVKVAKDCAYEIYYRKKP